MKPGTDAFRIVSGDLIDLAAQQRVDVFKACFAKCRMVQAMTLRPCW
jgi:hypothetical protein